MKRCKLCGDLLVLDKSICRCEPYEWARREGNEADPYDPSTIHLSGCIDLEDAASEINEKHFADWDYVDNSQIFIRKRGGDWRLIEVTVESVPSFSGNDVTADLAG
ncbi:MAG: hypothetical protein ACR2QF_11285 [Geminicoccaceae bacterium]